MPEGAEEKTLWALNTSPGRPDRLTSISGRRGPFSIEVERFLRDTFHWKRVRIDDDGGFAVTYIMLTQAEADARIAQQQIDDPV